MNAEEPGDSPIVASIKESSPKGSKPSSANSHGETVSGWIIEAMTG
jgi:hypothetical protein